MSAKAHLRIYRFEADSVFEGAIVGAVEQLETGPGLRLLDALFVARDAAAGELQAIDLATARADGTLAGMLDFRLDVGRRREMTRRTLATAGGVPPAVVAAMVAGLEPGAALLVVLLTEPAPTALDDAVARSGGRAVADEVVSAATLAEAAPRLSAAL